MAAALWERSDATKEVAMKNHGSGAPKKSLPLVLTAVVLVLLMVSGALASCAGDGSGSGKGKSQKLELPEVNYGGEEIVFLVTTETNWGNENIIADTLTGEPVNDAIYNRNAAVESLLNIKIKQIDCPYKEMEFKVTTAVAAGSREYDIVMPRLFSYASLVQQGQLLNVDNLTHVKQEKAWWDTNIRRDLSLLGNLYALTGSMHMYANDATWIMLFSKDLYADLNLRDTHGSVYDVVKKGKWTFDKFTEMMRGVTMDLDGDTKFTEKDRIAHLAANNNPIFAFISAAGESLFLKGNDTVTLNIGSEGFVNVVDKVIKLMNDDYMTLNTYNAKKWGEGAEGLKGQNALQKAIFADKRVLFRSEVLDVVDQYSDIDMDFGILPYPKYDEKQKDYVSIIIPDVVVTSVPIDCPDPDKISVILEAMAGKSHDTLLKAYYDVTLKRKNSRDDESAEMLDIIFGNRMYMFDMVFDWGGIKNSIIESVNESRNDMKTIEANLGEQIKNEIDATMKAVRENN